MEYKIRHCYSGIETYVIDFVGGTHSDCKVCYSWDQLVSLIAEAEELGHTKADGWLDGIKDCPSLYRYVAEKIIETNKIDVDALMDKKPVDYYDCTGYGDNQEEYVAVKGIDYDWRTETTRVVLYILDYDPERDWHATDRTVSVSLDYFKKAFKYAGTCYLY